MSELGCDAQVIVRAGRRFPAPTAADRERIARALRERLAGGLEPPNGGALTFTSVVGPARNGLMLLGAVLVVGWAIEASSPEARIENVAPRSPPALHTGADVAPVGIEAPITPPSPAVDAASTARAAEAPRPDGARSGAPRRSDRLAEEVSLLSRAETEFHAGRPVSALELLEEHALKFPSGALAQERTAARVHALCALGRTGEAESELRRLARVAPGSPQERRAREACATASER